MKMVEGLEGYSYSNRLHSFGKINLCITCMVGTDWLGRVAATEGGGIQGRQTGLSSTKPARVR